MTAGPEMRGVSVAEVAALTAQLRALAAAAADDDDGKRKQFLADKRELRDRIAAQQETTPDPDSE